MEKFYPPIHIRQILEYPNKTQVWVQFYEVAEDEFLAKCKKGENGGGIMKEEKMFELPKMNADEAREEIYKMVAKDTKFKKLNYEITPNIIR